MEHHLGNAILDIEGRHVETFDGVAKVSAVIHFN